MKNGARIIVTLKGAWTDTWDFVSANDDELVVADDAGRIDHIARTDVAEIRKPRSVLYELLAVPLAGALVLAGSFAGYAILGADKGLEGPLLGAVVFGGSTALLIGTMYQRSRVVYRAS